MNHKSYLTMDEVVWPKKGPDAASSYTVHCARLQVNKQGPGDIFTTCKQNGKDLRKQPELVILQKLQLLKNKLQSISCNHYITICLIEVDVDPLQLEVAITLIVACCIEPMFVTDHFPKLERQRRKSS